MKNRAFSYIAISLLTLQFVDCMNVTNAVYHADRTTAERVPLFVAVTDASYAFTKAKADYVTFASAFSGPTYHEVRLSMFKFSSDSSNAIATYSLGGINRNTTRTLSDWLSPGIAYDNGVIAFENSNRGLSPAIGTPC